jgi:unsaturated chondroitin disaccharide hydrolase
MFHPLLNGCYFASIPLERMQGPIDYFPISSNTNPFIVIRINNALAIKDLQPKLDKLWEFSAQKLKNIQKHYDDSKGSPVFTVNGQYTTRGWTEWTQGFQFGSAILHFDATQDKDQLEYARKKTVGLMAPHLSHTGVHDHGFNNISTYGNLLRLMHEKKIPANEWEKNFYELALKVSGTVQASRWTPIKNDGGFIHSFNGPHSLFVDTIRSCRSLMVSHKLGHVLQGENDIKISLLQRALKHCEATAQYSIYYGEGRDSYDMAGRTAHESIFNTKDGNYRCPNSQQGYSGFTTWTRGLAWAICGFAEELECLKQFNDDELQPFGGKEKIEAIFLKAAKAVCDFYIANSALDGIPYWDTGAPNLYKLGDYLDNAADPFNEYEPVDSSAAAIAAQGLLRLGHYLQSKDPLADKYWQAGLTVMDTLLGEPYLSTSSEHQGLLLHSVYHWPNGWDYLPPGSRIPFGESSMWGDYHLREAALYLHKMLKKESYYTFYHCVQ